MSKAYLSVAQLLDSKSCEVRRIVGGHCKGAVKEGDGKLTVRRQLLYCIARVRLDDRA